MTHHSSIPLLADEDVRQALTMHDAVTHMERAVRLHAEGQLIAPPRFRVDAQAGALVFTAGGVQGESLGFRVYSTFPAAGDPSPQLVVVHDGATGRLRGLLTSDLLGVMRTGALGGVAVNHLARRDAHRVGVLGSGPQAWSQLAAACAVRDVTTVMVHSPTASRREAFARRAAHELHLNATATDDAREVTEQADILIVATSSHAPVLSADWVRPGTHVSTLGPKFVAAHEVPLDLAARSSAIVTDSLAQAQAYTPPFFLTGTPHLQRTAELGAIVTGRASGRATNDDITLFCSVGLAGTEVVLADAVLAALGHA